MQTRSPLGALAVCAAIAAGVCALPGVTPILVAATVAPATKPTPAKAPFHQAELIFPPEHWHNHGSCIVETPNDDLLVCWFHGSGERKADDVKIEGARKRSGSTTWSPRFTMADTPNYPDTNCAMIVDPRGQLWLFWPTILANEWHSALLKYHCSTNYQSDGPPQWFRESVLHVTPGPEFETQALRFLASVEPLLKESRWSAEDRKELNAYIEGVKRFASDKLFQRLGWMTRAHPFILEDRRLIVPLYSDGVSFSLMAFSDDWGLTWHTSTPLVGIGNIQPSIVRRQDGSLYTLMRDNGPSPKRLLQSVSFDRGATWGPVTDSDLPNPGSGAEVIQLRSGEWVLIGNDTEEGRHQLVVQVSSDEGRTWPWKRYLERDAGPGPVGRYHYPSILQSRDGSLHASYSVHWPESEVGKDAEGRPNSKTIKHAHFNLEWVKAGD